MIDERLKPEWAKYQHTRSELGAAKIEGREVTTEIVRSWWRAWRLVAQDQHGGGPSLPSLEARLAPTAKSAASAVAALAKGEDTDSAFAIAGVIGSIVGEETRKETPTWAALSQALAFCPSSAWQVFEDSFATAEQNPQSWVDVIRAFRPQADDLYQVRERGTLGGHDEAFVRQQVEARALVRQPLGVWHERHSTFVPYRDEPLRHLSLLRRLSLFDWLCAVDDLPTIDIAVDVLTDWRFACDPDELLRALDLAPSPESAGDGESISISAALVLNACVGFGDRLSGELAARARTAPRVADADAAQSELEEVLAVELPEWADRVAAKALEREEGTSLLLDYASFTSDETLRLQTNPNVDTSYKRIVQRRLAQSLYAGGSRVDSVRARSEELAAPRLSYVIVAALPCEGLPQEDEERARLRSWLGVVLIEHGSGVDLLTGGRGNPQLPEFELDALARGAPTSSEPFSEWWAGLAAQRRARSFLRYEISVGATTPSRVALWLALIALEAGSQKLAADALPYGDAGWQAVRDRWVQLFDAARTLRLIDGWGLDGDAALDIVRCLAIALELRPGFASDAAFDAWLSPSVALVAGDVEVVTSLAATLHSAGLSVDRVFALFAGASRAEIRGCIKNAAAWFRVCGRDSGLEPLDVFLVEETE